ncbi:MAG: hypothetical protein OXR66_08120 [Candidatus Woesearchaeota archaeon]|nr:hypothetical protein [Candidatus Woesearchaeota archaeon]
MDEQHETFRELHTLNDIVHEVGEQYHHSQPIVTPSHGILLPRNVQHSFTFKYDIKDIFTIGAITQSALLLTGGTDLGKTALSRLMMNAFFGKEEEGWHRIDVDNDFGSATYTDHDMGVLADGKKQSQGFYNAMPWLQLPGLIVDEINRGHAKVVNKLLHVFDGDVSLPNGERVKIGHKTGEETYQFRVAAINEGAGYSGTFDMDKALRRRTTIEIPIDVFPATPADLLALQRSPDRNIQLTNRENNLQKILVARNTGHTLPVHPAAELLVAYMEQFDYCKHSLTGYKGSVAARGGSIYHICTQPTNVEDGIATGCEFLKSFEHNLCPYVRGVTPGVSRNIRRVARGFAMLRATKFTNMVASWMEGTYEGVDFKLTSPEKFEESLQAYTSTKHSGQDLARAAVATYCENLEVEVSDIEAAFGLVGYSKVGISSQFTSKHFQGNQFHAVMHFLREARGKFEEGIERQELVTLMKGGDNTLSQQDMISISMYCRNSNPWLLRALEPHLQQQSTQRPRDVQALYGR